MSRNLNLVVVLVTTLAASATAVQHPQGRRGGPPPQMPPRQQPDQQAYVNTRVVTDNYYANVEWTKLKKQGKLPYHLLTEKDFQVNNLVESNSLAYTEGFVTYQVQTATFDRGTRVKATEVTVRSGFDYKNSWRRSSLADPNVYLQHEQGHLDLHEIGVQKFVQRLRTTNLEATGRTTREAERQLAKLIGNILDQTRTETEREQEQYETQTNTGLNSAAQEVFNRQTKARLQTMGIVPMWNRPAGT